MLATRRLAVLAAGVGILLLGVLEAALGAWSEQTAALFPEVAHLRAPVLVAAVGVCAAGQLALLLGLALGRVARWALVALLVAMAVVLVGIERITTASDATPPAVVLTCWGGAALCLVIALVVATRARRSQPSSPAARAGSA